MIRASFLNGNNQVQDYDFSKIFESFRTEWVISWMQVTTNSVWVWYWFITVTRGTQTWLMLVDIQTAETISTSGTKKVWIDIDQTKVDTPSSNPTDGSTIARIQTGASYPGSWNYIKLASITGWAITDDREFSTFTLLAALAQDQTFSWLNTFSQFPITPSSAPTTNYQVANKKYVDDLLAAIIPYASDAEAKAWVSTTKLISAAQAKNLIDLYNIVAGTTYTLASANTSRSLESYGSFTKIKEISVPFAGTYKTTFDLTCTWSWNIANGRIYKNGVAFGTARANSVSGSTTYTEDLTFAAGDLIQVYWYRSWSAGSTTVANFQIKCDLQPRQTLYNWTVALD